MAQARDVLAALDAERIDHPYAWAVEALRQTFEEAALRIHDATMTMEVE